MNGRTRAEYKRKDEYEAHNQEGPVKLYTVPEIMEEQLKVFPRSGTTENSIYYWASKTEGVSLSKSNTQVDKSAYAALMGTAAEEPEAKKPEPTVDALREQIRLEVEAEIAERARLLKESRAAARQVRVIKKNERIA
jgi:hypothetical protein